MIKKLTKSIDGFEFFIGLVTIFFSYIYFCYANLFFIGGSASVVARATFAGSMVITVALWLVYPSRIAVALLAVTAFFLPPLLIGESIYPLATVVIEVILGVVLIGVTAAIRKNWTSA
jgi:hypothetical protein